MDLGLKGKQALISGGSKGIGNAVAQALAQEGVNLVLVARGKEALQQTAEHIRSSFGVAVTTVAADVSTEEGRKAVAAICATPDILLTNAAGPAPGDFRTWSHETWQQALDTNMLAPIALIQMYVDGMAERKFGRIVNITTAGIKAPPAGFALSIASRLGLTGFVAGLAREVARANVTINNVLPGATQTERFDAVTAYLAKTKGVSAEKLQEDMLQTVPAGRFAEPGEIGLACAFLCSAHSGYITGQNLVIDGGSYPGVF